VKELFEKLDRAVLNGRKCLVVSDADYQSLQHEVWEREKVLGIVRDGSVKFLIFHGTRVFSVSQTAMIPGGEDDG